MSDKVDWNVAPRKQFYDEPPIGRPVLVKFKHRTNAVTVQQDAPGEWRAFGVNGQIGGPFVTETVVAWAEIPKVPA